LPESAGTLPELAGTLQELCLLLNAAKGNFKEFYSAGQISLMNSIDQSTWCWQELSPSGKEPNSHLLLHLPPCFLHTHIQHNVSSLLAQMTWRFLPMPSK
jgi:hypothetical protein